jgi:hypothetical protein
MRLLDDCIVPCEVFEKRGWTWSTQATNETDVCDRLSRTLVADRGPEGAKRSLWYRAVAQLCLNNFLCDGTLDIDEAFFEADSQATAYLERVRKVIRNRKLFESTSATGQRTLQTNDEHLVGFRPQDTRYGDLIVVMYGCSVSVFLRSVKKLCGGAQEYHFIGEAFVQHDGSFRHEL